MHAIPGEIKESFDGEKRTLNVANCVINAPRRIKPRKLEEGEDIDTGVSDGSGTIDVSAFNEIRQVSPRSVQLFHLRIETTGDRAKGSDVSIINEAAEMIMSDYLK